MQGPRRRVRSVKWVIVGIAAGILLAAAHPAAAQPPPGGTFFDDDTSPHEADIEALAQVGILRGCNPPAGDLVCPERLLTRGEMAALLARGFALPGSETDRFVDDEASTFEADIDALAAAGITKGCNPPSNDRYCPNDPVTRGEMAAFLVRASGLAPSRTNAFVDDETSTFEADIDALAAAGITKGCNPPSNDRYCPNHPIIREQLATFLVRTLGLAPVPVPTRPSFSIAASGDVLIHMPTSSRAAEYGRSSGTRYDFRPMYRPIKSIVESADLAICHLEVPLSPTSDGLSGYPTFNAPREVADALAYAGYDGCSTASNHSLDQGFAGIVDTLDVLDDAGLGHSGTARTADEARTIRTYVVGDATVAHLSYTYGFNGLPLPDGRPWAANRIDVARILADAERARRSGGDLVAVSLHWGAEYRQAPTDAQRDLARRVLTSQHVDVILGHHAHVVQPVGWLDGEYVVYGMGNQLSNQRSQAATQDGVIVRLDVALRGDRWAVRSVGYTPTWVRGTTFEILPASPDRSGALGASAARTGQAITALDAPGVELLD